MKAGGNDRAKEWMEKYNVKETDLKNKYSSPAFESYREKLKAAVEGRNFVDPSPDDIAKKASPYGSRTGSPSLGSYSPSPQYARSGGQSEYSQLSRSSEMRSTSAPRGNSMTSSGGYNGNSNGGYSNGYSSGYNSGGGYNGGGYNNGGGYDNGSGPQRGDLRSSGSGYNDSQDMHTRFAGRKAIGSADFEPTSSRSSPGPHGGSNGEDELMSAFYDGWSRFSTGVKQAASSAAEKVSSGALTDEVSQLATRVTESQTWNYVTSFFSGDSDQPQQQHRGPPTRDERAYSNERPPPPRDSEDDRRGGGFSSRDHREPGYTGYGGRDERDAPMQRSYSAQPQTSTSGGSRATGERQGLRNDNFADPTRRPQTQPARSANGWGGSNEDWDDWDASGRSSKSSASKSGSNPHVAVANDEEDLELDAYTGKAPPQRAVAAPQPSRAPSHQPPPADDIYDFQIGSTSSSKTSSPAPTNFSSQAKPVTTAAPGWDDWDDWGRGK